MSAVSGGAGSARSSSSGLSERKPGETGLVGAISQPALVGFHSLSPGLEPQGDAGHGPRR